MTSSASSVSQYAAEVALSAVADTWMRDRVGELQDKRDLAYSLLLQIPNVSCPLPSGAFYLLPKVSHYYNTKTPSGRAVTNSHELCLELLRDEKVALVSGTSIVFYHQSQWQLNHHGRRCLWSAGYHSHFVRCFERTHYRIHYPIREVFSESEIMTVLEANL